MSRSSGAFDPDAIPSLKAFLKKGRYVNLGQAKAVGRYGQPETAIFIDTGEDLIIGRTWFHMEPGGEVEKIGKCVHVPYEFLAVLKAGVNAVLRKYARADGPNGGDAGV